ncbi:MAG TPA: SMC family ATPase [Bacteroidales bacterium]|jgi:exonuclease SbcC|nr:SMC family ATPase [Bacteroidales bacterium]
MIPIELTIQGLYSYQERQTIDFTRLTAANLFGIFGPVGSGKSTILEAITFAVYGRTDRLNLSGDNRYYNMMNLRSNEMLIDFIFEAGREQTTYRATVKSSRNSKNFDDVYTPKRTAYRKREGQWEPIEVEALEEIIGLSYDNFKRTIIIPQGQFQEFLQLGNRDRTKMMKELFNLEKFEFYYKVVSLEKKNDEKRQHIQGQLQQLGEVDLAQIASCSESLAALEKEVQELNKGLQEQQQEEEKLRQLRELFEKREAAQKERDALAKQAPHYQELREKIERYERAVLGFKHLLESRKTYEEKATKRREQIQGDQKKLQTETREMTRLEKILEEIRPKQEKRDEVKKRAEELERLLAMRGTEERIKHEQTRLEKGTKIWEETVQSLEHAKAEKLRQEKAIQSMREKMPDLTSLTSLKEWHMERREIQRQLRSCEEEVAKFARQLEELEKEKCKLTGDPLFKTLHESLPGPLQGPLQESLPELLPELFLELSTEPILTPIPATTPPGLPYPDIFHHLEGESWKIKEQQRLLGDQENHWRVKAQLKAYADDLQENQPCPLCGSLHHPDPGRYSSEDINKELKKIDKQKLAWEKQLDHIAFLNKRFTLLESRQNEATRHREEWEKKKKELLEKAAAHEKRFAIDLPPTDSPLLPSEQEVKSPWEVYRKEEALDKAFEAAKKIQEELKVAEKLLKQAEKERQTKEQAKDKYQEGLQEIKTSLAMHQAKWNTLAQQLTVIQYEAYEDIPVKAIEQEKKRLVEEYQQVEKTFNETSQLLQNCQQLINKLNGVLETNLKELKQEESALEALENRLKEQLGQSKFTSLEEVTRLLSAPFDPATERQNLERYREQILRNLSTLEQLQREIAERTYDPAAHEKLIAVISQLKEEIHQKTQEKGKMAEKLKNMQQDLESLTKLKQELEGLNARGENITTLKSLFKASGFVNYISSVYLQNLCNAANERFFQLTRQRLSLEITDDNNFQVRDYLNGGKVRSVKTLSGGQTFQASLSLALALADNIQQVTESKQNFFFLDEGFGSLDKESLNIVFDTLKSLRKENRIVGVISHVEEMQQEIDAHLTVENHPERGSLIHR